MKSFLKFAAKIPDNYLPKIEQSITRAVEVLSDPNASSDAYDAVAKQLADIQRTVGKDAAKAWKGEVAERLKASWIEAGRDGIAMEQQVAPKLSRILESSEKLRAVMQSAYVKAVVAKLALGLGAATILIGAIAGVGMKPAKVDNPVTPPVAQVADERPAGPPPNTVEEISEPAPVPEPEKAPTDPFSVPMGMGHAGQSDQTIADKLAELKKLPPQEPAAAVVFPEIKPAVLRPKSLPLPPPRSGFNPPVLPALKDFSVTACRAPDEAANAVVYLYSPHYDFAYKDNDDREASNLAIGLGDCQRKLFYQLIAMIRAEQYWKVDRQWIRTAVTPWHPEFNAAPPSTTQGGGRPPKNPDAGCFMQSNPFGPPYRVCPVN